MASYSGINVHDCKMIRAEAVAYEGSTWLALKFDDGATDLSIFMPFDRAQRIADAINTAEVAPPVQEAAE